MLIVAAINLLLMLLFPPYDYHGYTQYSAPTFGGFLFAFADHPNRVLNDNFLSIEIFVVLINTAIAWLLLHPRARLRRQLDRQNLVLMGVALNLLLALLFPPFQDHYAVSTAVLPTFDGFYFVFGDNSTRVVVATMLWIEVIFVLINGAILWLLLRRSSPQEMTAAERFAQSAELLGASRRRKT
ncbi:MAG TPA: hypothetical protein VMV87_09540 [Burkholderiales bacterium]|nr:hypothetical protein [Burkholderiales bacterium]